MREKQFTCSHNTKTMRRIQYKEYKTFDLYNIYYNKIISYLREGQS